MALSCRRLACVAALALVAACGAQNSGVLVEQAQTDLTRGDTAAAIVRLKTALQAEPDLGIARLTLGQAFLSSGDPRAAALELDKALQAQQPPALVLPLLGQALVASGEAARFIAMHRETQVPGAEGSAALKAALAAAHASQGQVQQAAALIDEAEQLAPQEPAVVLMRARLLVRERDLTGARARVDALLATADGKTSAEAWRLQGDLRLLANEPVDAALAAYRQALVVKPGDLASRTALVAALIQARRLDEAGKELAPLLAAGAPDNVRTQWLQAQLAVQRQDFRTARQISDALIKVAPDLARVRELAGALDARDGALQQAEAHLQKALRLDADSPVARQLLTQTYLRSGQPQRALDTLQPALDKGQPAPEVLALAAEAHLQLGDAKAAEAHFRQAARQAPEDAQVRTGLALSRQAQGHGDEALASLQATAAVDAGTAADLALVQSLTARRQWPAALQALDRLQAKTPGQALAPFLRGQVERQRGNIDAARTAFEAAVAADGAYFPAVAALVQLDVRARQPASARDRLQRLLKVDPGHVPGLLMLAELQAQAGAQLQAPPGEVARLLQQAIAARPDNAQARVLLVNHYLAARDTRSALTAAEQALGALPANALVLDAVGRARLAGGDGQQALAAFRKLAALQPESAAPWLRMSEAQMLLKDRQAAEGAARKALALQPGSLDAQRALILLALNGGAPQEALAVARSVQRQRPKEAVGWVLEGDIAAAQRQWPAAATAYRQALARLDGAGATDVAMKLHAALAASDAPRGAGAPEPAPPAARQFAEQWIAAHPRDGLFLLHLGDLAQARGDMAAAESHYQRAVGAQPKDPQALNNLAWVQLQLNKPTALAHAEQANALLPDRPELLDTLAQALAAAGQLPRALEVQRRALALLPGNPLLRFNLARLLVQSGDRAQARKELELVAKAGDKFKDQAAVQALLAKL